MAAALQSAVNKLSASLNVNVPVYIDSTRVANAVVNQVRRRLVSGRAQPGLKEGCAMAMLTLNGAALPDPSALSVELQDALLSARRTLSGAASVSRAAVKRRVRCYWAHMPAGAAGRHALALAGSAVATLSYPDPLTGQSRAMQAYCGERSVGLARQSGGETVWTGVEIIFMEA